MEMLSHWNQQNKKIKEKRESEKWSWISLTHRPCERLITYWEVISSQIKNHRIKNRIRILVAGSTRRVVGTNNKSI